MSVLSHEFDDIIFCGSLVIFEAISYYGDQSFSLHGPKASLPVYLITCSTPHRTSKDEDILYLSRKLLLTLKDDFTLYGSMFKAETYNFLGFTSHGFNSHCTFFLSSVDLSCSTWVQFSSCNCLCS